MERLRRFAQWIERIIKEEWARHWHSAVAGADGEDVSRFQVPWKRVLPVAVGLFLLIAVTVDFGVTKQNTLQGEAVAASATIASPASFWDDDSFTLEGVEKMDAVYIREHLVLTPDANFTVTKTADDSDEAVVKVIRPQRVSYDISLLEPFTKKTLRWSIPAPELTVKLVSGSIGVNGPVALEFSDPVSVFMVEKNLTVSPSMRFQVELSGTRVNLIPIGSLPYSTKYELALASGMLSKTGNTSTRGYVFEVETVPAPTLPSERPVIESPEAQKPHKANSVEITGAAARMCGSRNPIDLEFEVYSTKGVPVTITTYRFPSAEKYLDQSQMMVDYAFEAGDILEKLDVTLEVLESGLRTISLPNAGAGGYLIEATFPHPGTGETARRRVAVFVTDISLYMQTVGSETLVWANSSATGLPLGGYQVSFLKKDETEAFATGTTDATGVAVLNRTQVVEEITEDNDYSGYMYGYGIPEGEKAFAVQVKDGGGQVVYADGSNIIYPNLTTGAQNEDDYYYEYYNPNKYYSFFYTDRPIYKPTDEINFWGYLKGHSSNAEATPTEVEVSLTGQEDVVVTVPVGANGTFSGLLTYEQIKSSQYEVTARVKLPRTKLDEEGAEVTEQRLFFLESAYVDIKDYEKPLFVISSSTDKDYYVDGEMVTAYITPQFYDGTPLPNYPLELTHLGYYYGAEGEIQKITTDETGTATVQFPANQLKGSETGWNPVATRYKVKVASDGQNVVHYGEYTVFPSPVMLQGTIGRQLNGNLTVAVGSSDIVLPDPVDDRPFVEQVTLDQPENTVADPAKFAALGGPARDMTVTAEMKYTYYDTQRNYYEDERLMSVTTVGGVGTLADILPDGFSADAPMNLDMTLTAKLPDGRELVYERNYNYYPAGWTRYGRGQQETERPVAPGYSLDVTDGSGVSRTQEYYEYMTYDSVSFGDRELMNFSLRKDGKDVDTGGRILYTMLQNGMVDRSIVEGTGFTINQSTRWASSAMVVAAYFDGETVYPIRDIEISFILDSAKLDLEVTSDKISYRPGETVTLTVSVTEASTGAGVAGNALLSVVDESVFALREQYITILSDLYGDMYFSSQYIPKYTTTTGDVTLPGGGDGGKGGDESGDFYDMLRKNFKDTAAFLPVRTDAGGSGTVSFVLPDNTTSWRVTALGVGDNLYAGNSKSHIISSLPFFMNPVVSTKYVEGDEVAMLVQGHGTALDEKSDIGYSVRVQGDGFDKTLTADGKAFRSQELNFGVLPVGEYTLSATAQYSGYRDTVELPLAVIPSNLELVVNKRLDLTKPLDIDAMRYPVTVSFYDQEFQPYYSSISSLLTHYCMIANQRMSRFVAKRALSRYMDPAAVPQHIQEGNDSAADMQNEDGGIGWYVGDMSEPVLTAKVLLVASDQFNHNAMADYFKNVLESASGMSAAASYLGLAALGEPIAPEIVQQLDQQKLTEAQRAYLIAGLAYAGEKEAAQKYYDELLVPKRLEGESGAVYYRSTWLNSRRRAKLGGSTPEQRQADTELTAAVWVAASALGIDDADGISLYFAKEKWRIDTLFECMIYVTNYNKEVTPISFPYTVEGQQQTIDLGLKGQQSIALNRSQLESLVLANVPDRVEATAYYIGEPSEVDIEPSKKVGIEKKITKLEDGKYRFDIKVNLLPGAPDGYYDVSEWVPSNMRLYSVNGSDVQTGEDEFSYTTEGQKVRFRIYRSSETVAAKNITISYVAQKTYNSKAVVDSTYIIHGNSGENNYTQRYLLEE